jgi:hypothetical protein
MGTGRLKQTLLLSAATTLVLALIGVVGHAAVRWFGVAGLAVFIVVVSLGVAVAFIAVVFSMIFGAPYVPVADDRLAAMLEMAKIKAGERLVDLGSGDGKILFAAARQGALTEGWEINPYLCVWTWAAARWHGLAPRVKVHCHSYWDDKYGTADVVALYLLPSQMARLEKKLLAELRPGTRVVSAGFVFPNWKPTQELNGSRLYVVPPTGSLS